MSQREENDHHGVRERKRGEEKQVKTENLEFPAYSEVEAQILQEIKSHFPPIFLEDNYTIVRDDVTYSHYITEEKFRNVTSIGCDGTANFFFLIIFSTPNPSSYKRRELIRKVFSGDEFLSSIFYSFLFFLGLPDGDSADKFQEEIKLESRTHKDIVQINIIDSFENSLIKCMSIFNWISNKSFCAVHTSMVRMDDSFIVRVARINSLVTPYYNFRNNKLFLGRILTNRKLNVSILKYGMVTQKHLQHTNAYPSYIDGRFFIMSIDVMRKLCEADLVTRRLFPSDAYLSILAVKLGILLTDLGKVHQIWKFENFDHFKKELLGIDRSNIVAFEFESLKENITEVKKLLLEEKFLI